MKRIYLDHAATTQPAPEVIAAVRKAMESEWGNASSAHSPGQAAKRMVEEARTSVAALIGAKPGEIHFTSGATESNNQVIRGSVEALRGKGDRLVISAVEHPCVEESAKRVEKHGWKVERAGVDGTGVLDMAAFGKALGERTALVSVMLANNETGSIQPVAEAAKAAKAAGALVHTDATQAAGRIRVSVDELGVDYLSLSAHKFYGPKGAGALYVRRGAPLAPFLLGGSQERGKRGGTLNVPGIAGMGAAAGMAARDLEGRAARAREARDALERGMFSRITGCALNGHPGKRLPSHLNVSFSGVDGEALLMALDVAGVAASTGSACASGTAEPSRVLTAMGLPRERVLSAIRFTTGEANLAGDAAAALEIIVAAVERLRRSSPRAR